MSSGGPIDRKILVVDDDLSIREMIAQVLEDEGYRVASASDGSEALTYLKTSSELPCVILLDLKMPIMDGIEFRMQQTQDSRISAIPVLLLTADQNHQAARSKITVTNVLSKPVKLDTLLDAIQRAGC